ncbi:MAG: 50S ribosomal protein L4 [Gammaproteobacteria bacterium]
MELGVYSNESGDAVGSLNVSDKLFAARYNEPLVHQVVNAYLAGARAGTKANKSRSQVSGGGRKPWRQKGMGRARAGSSRSPLWRGGGVTFAAVPRNYAQKVNKKMYRGALRSLFSELLRQGRLRVLDGLVLEAPKTKMLRSRLTKLGVEGALILTEEVSENLYLAARNLPKVSLRDVASVDPVALLSSDTVLITQDAVAKLEAQLS